MINLREIERTHTTFGKFERIDFPPYALSVQAGKYYYSRPRENYNKLGNYSHIELGLLHNGKLINPKEDEMFMEFEKANILFRYFQDSDTPVAENVPLELIQSLCNFLEEKYNERVQTPEDWLKESK